jgi:hypothetical protein
MKNLLQSLDFARHFVPCATNGKLQGLGCADQAIATLLHVVRQIALRIAIGWPRILLRPRIIFVNGLCMVGLGFGDWDWVNFNAVAD